MFQEFCLEMIQVVEDVEMSSSENVDTELVKIVTNLFVLVFTLAFVVIQSLLYF